VGGGKPTALVIGLAVTGVLVLLPALIVPVFYLFANVYALVTGADFGSGTVNVAVLFVGLVLTVALLLLLLSAGVAFIGRSLSPKNRPENREA
jgi:membrane protein implicated in regulation of membrane protease activity